MVLNEQYPYSAPPLPYAYDALEPFLNEETVRLHHNVLMQAYVDKLNATMKDNPDYQDWSLKALLIYADGFPPKLRTSIKNNGGGIYSHENYFDSMGPKHDQIPTGHLAQALQKSFGSYESFKQKMKEMALARFGSGWIWLIFDAYCTLQLISTPNQDVPLPSLFHPLLCLDVWEHAYFLQYKSNRSEYIDNWFRLIDWEKAEQRYACG